MKFELSKSLLNELYDVTKIVTDEIRLHTDENGWSMMAVDPSRIAMVKYQIPSNAFFLYQPEVRDVAFPLEVLRSVLSIADDTIFIEFDETRVIFKTGSITRRATLVFYDGSVPKIPDLDLTTTVELDTSNVQRAMKGVKFVDYIKITAENNTLTVSAEGDTDMLEVSHDIAEQPPGTVVSCYPMAYFMTAIEAFPQRVTLAYSQDYPLTITSNVNGQIEYMLAPRIENGE